MNKRTLVERNLPFFFFQSFRDRSTFFFFTRYNAENFIDDDALLIFIFTAIISKKNLLPRFRDTRFSNCKREIIAWIFDRNFYMRTIEFFTCDAIRSRIYFVDCVIRVFYVSVKFAFFFFFSRSYTINTRDIERHGAVFKFLRERTRILLLSGWMRSSFSIMSLKPSMKKSIGTMRSNQLFWCKC